ncbi:hypothetical protein THAOC_14255, partial [Thalassiosira oceanica]
MQETSGTLRSSGGVVGAEDAAQQRHFAQSPDSVPVFSPYCMPGPSLLLLPPKYISPECPEGTPLRSHGVDCFAAIRGRPPAAQQESARAEEQSLVGRRVMALHPPHRPAMPHATGVSACDAGTRVAQNEVSACVLTYRYLVFDSTYSSCKPDHAYTGRPEDRDGTARSTCWNSQTQTPLHLLAEEACIAKECG